MKSLIFKVAIFAIAFAFVEAAVVVYLRHLLGVNFTPPQVERSEILFLLSIPWVGPVFVPLLISSLLIVSALLYLNLKKAKL